ncbi:MAG: hypothetical protein WCP93_00995 [Candidatus Berkelbacteria bacterium]
MDKSEINLNEPINVYAEKNVRLNEQFKGELLTSNWQERLKNLGGDAEGLIHFVSLMDARQSQEVQLEHKHGRQIPKLHQIMAGDLNYELTPEGLVKHNTFNEFINHTARVFDKKTVTGLVSYGVVSLACGGFGLPGVLAAAGVLIGRTSVEIAAAVKGAEKLSQNDIAHQMSSEWAELSEKAKAWMSQKENMEPEEKEALAKEIFDGFYHKSEDMLRLEGQLADHSKEVNKAQETAGKWGLGLGLGAGWGAGLFGGLDMMTAAKFDQDIVHHAVRYVDGAWSAFGKPYLGHGAKIMGNAFMGMVSLLGGFKLGAMLSRKDKETETILTENNQANLLAQEKKMELDASKFE